MPANPTSHASAPVPADQDGVSRSTIGSAVQVHHRLTNAEREEVAAPVSSSSFQQSVVTSRWRHSHGEIKILGGARRLEPEFHRVAAFQDQVCIRRSKKPGKEPIEGHQPAKPLEFDPVLARHAPEAFLKCGAECGAGSVFPFSGQFVPFRISARIEARSAS